jgi:hypothetical protein
MRCSAIGTPIGQILRAKVFHPVHLKVIWVSEGGLNFADKSGGKGGLHRPLHDWPSLPGRTEPVGPPAPGIQSRGVPKVAYVSPQGSVPLRYAPLSSPRRVGLFEGGNICAVFLS